LKRQSRASFRTPCPLPSSHEGDAPSPPAYAQRAQKDFSPARNRLCYAVLVRDFAPLGPLRSSRE
jgi:hypothetical protein